MLWACRIQGTRRDVSPHRHKLEGSCSRSDTASLHLRRENEYTNDGINLSDLQCSGAGAFLNGENLAGDVPWLSVFLNNSNVIAAVKAGHLPEKIVRALCQWWHLQRLTGRQRHRGKRITQREPYRAYCGQESSADLCLPNQPSVASFVSSLRAVGPSQAGGLPGFYLEEPGISIQQYVARKNSSLTPCQIKRVEVISVYEIGGLVSYLRTIRWRLLVPMKTSDVSPSNRQETYDSVYNGFILELRRNFDAMRNCCANLSMCYGTLP